MSWYKRALGNNNIAFIKPDGTYISHFGSHIETLVRLYKIEKTENNYFKIVKKYKLIRVTYLGPEIDFEVYSKPTQNQISSMANLAHSNKMDIINVDYNGVFKEFRTIGDFLRFFGETQINKKAFNISDNIAMTIAQMMIESYNGVSYNGLSKTKNIVSNIPDEKTLSEAIAKATMLAANALKIGDDIQNDERITSIIQELQSSFFAMKQVKQIQNNNNNFSQNNKIEPEIGDSTQNIVPQIQEPIEPQEEIPAQ